jgi:hypothetical protein
VWEEASWIVRGRVGCWDLNASLTGAMINAEK